MQNTTNDHNENLILLHTQMRRDANWNLGHGLTRHIYECGKIKPVNGAPNAILLLSKFIVEYNNYVYKIASWGKQHQSFFNEILFWWIYLLNATVSFIKHVNTISLNIDDICIFLVGLISELCYINVVNGVLQK